VYSCKSTINDRKHKGVRQRKHNEDILSTRKQNVRQI
jgi:hypothetical protein